MIQYEPGDNMIVRRLPCIECGGTPARYIERRLCALCYQRRAKRRGLGRLSLPEKIAMWTTPHGDCLLWLGSISPEGYGRIGREYVHRLNYELEVGPIPEGLQIDHLCKNRWCCAPRHLEPVTGAENVRRAFAHITHCPQGHRYADGNFTQQGGRQCRTCARERARARSTSRRLEVAS